MQADSRKSLIRYASMTLALCAVLAARRWENIVSPELYAEDGSVWYPDQVVLGSRAIFKLQWGYWQAGARVIAWFADWFPYRHGPAVIQASSLVVGAMCCSVFSLSRFRQYLSSDALRCVLCLAAAGAINTEELVGNATNVQWYLLLAASLLVLAPPESSSPLGHGAAIFGGAFLAAAHPLAALAVPVYGATFLLEKRKFNAFVLGVFLGAAVQLVWSRLATHSFVLPTVNWDEWWRLPFGVLRHWFYRVVVSAFAGDAHARAWAAELPAWFGPLGGALLVAAIAFATRALEPRKRWFVAVAAYFAVAEFLVPIVLRHETGLLLHPSAVMGRSERYYFLPAFATAFVLALFLERLPKEGAWKPVVFAALFSAGPIFNGPLEPLPNTNWPGSAVHLEAWAEARKNHQPHPGLALPIYPPWWAMRLPPLP